MTTLTPETLQQARRDAFAKAVDKARATNTKLVLWHDGRMVRVHPDELDHV